MQASPESLKQFLDCEKMDVDLYRGQSQDFKTGQVYGGQVLGQAISAAYDTVEKDRFIRSAHAYFLRPGDVNAPIIYEVDRPMDGRTVSSRRIVAKQHGKQILHLSASFQLADDSGYDWSENIDLPQNTITEDYVADHELGKHFQKSYVRLVNIDPQHRTDPQALQMWMKVKENLPSERRLHEAMMTYVTDLGLLYSTTVPLGLEGELFQRKKRSFQMMSIDHAIWFHRPFRLDDWVFHSCKAISASYGRANAIGRLYNRQGELLVSSAQEGVLRKIDQAS